MKNKLSVALLALGLTTLTITAASAHPYYPHHHHGWYGPSFFPSVGFVINTSDNDDSGYVKLVGHVFRQTGDSTYLFTDGNNTYRLNSDDSNLPIGPTIVVGGQFDDGQVDIRKWHYAQ